MREIHQGRPLSAAERERVLAMLQGGKSPEQAGLEFGCSRSTAYRVWWDWQLRGRRPGRSSLRLSLGEREEISRGLEAGKGVRQIARELGRAPSTISREVAANKGPVHYRALKAERRAVRCAARPKTGKLSSSPRLRAVVEGWLEQQWSPQQISARLVEEFPDDPEMRISHETIYQALYVQSRGELRRQLTENLRWQRTKRKSRSSLPSSRGRINGMVPISERPPEIEDRAVPGHWEGDLLVGSRNQSFIVTLVERQTRYVLLARLGDRATTDHVIDALRARIATLPDHLLRSLTWDQGKELSAHRRFTVETGLPVFFCDPHSPWQRGSNENTNGLLRQYLPKGTDLATHSQADLDAIAARLNGRPRQTLGWKTPAEKLNELLR